MIEQVTRTSNEKEIPGCIKLMWVNQRLVMQLETMFRTYEE